MANLFRKRKESEAEIVDKERLAILMTQMNKGNLKSKKERSERELRERFESRKFVNQLLRAS